MLVPARSDGRTHRQPWRVTWTALLVALFGVMCSDRDPEGTALSGVGSSSSQPEAGADGGGQGGAAVDAGGAGPATVDVGGVASGGGAGSDGIDPGEPPALGGGSPGGDAGGGASSSGAASGGTPGDAGAAFGGASGGEAPSGSEPSGLPCDVEKLLRARCQSCHGRTPVEGAGVSLMTHADLTAPSKVLPSTTVGARSLKRMTDSLAPMPPGPLPLPTDAEITALRSWLQVGMQPASCDGEQNPSDDPYDALATCTSGNFWPAGIDSGFWGMMPGRNCLECHKQHPQFAPIFSVAGTVYPTAHEPDRCYGVPVATSAKIIITDAKGVEHPPVPVVSGGNFGAILSGLALPYRAKVVVDGTERVMLTPQTNGDCNVCHSQAGTQGARGRIILP